MKGKLRHTVVCVSIIIGLMGSHQTKAQFDMIMGGLEALTGAMDQLSLLQGIDDKMEELKNITDQANKIRTGLDFYDQLETAMELRDGLGELICAGGALRDLQEAYRRDIARYKNRLGLENYESNSCFVGYDYELMVLDIKQYMDYYKALFDFASSFNNAERLEIQQKLLELNKKIKSDVDSMQNVVNKERAVIAELEYNRENLQPISMTIYEEMEDYTVWERLGRDLAGDGIRGIVEMIVTLILAIGLIGVIWVNIIDAGSGFDTGTGMKAIIGWVIAFFTYILVRGIL